MPPSPAEGLGGESYDVDQPTASAAFTEQSGAEELLAQGGARWGLISHLPPGKPALSVISLFFRLRVVLDLAQLFTGARSKHSSRHLPGATSLWGRCEQHSAWLPAKAPSRKCPRLQSPPLHTGIASSVSQARIKTGPYLPR